MISIRVCDQHGQSVCFGDPAVPDGGRVMPDRALAAGATANCRPINLEAPMRIVKLLLVNIVLTVAIIAGGHAFFWFFG